MGEEGNSNPECWAGVKELHCSHCFDEVWGKTDLQSKQDFHSHLCQL